jgi:uncharacterized protein YceH (UPF0502 family)
MGITVPLTPEEIRVVGCLLEKAITTPDQHPLTLNALTLACNQKSSREPVMSLEQGSVERTARQLSEKHLISVTEGKNGVNKYAQRLCNTLLSSLKFSAAEYAVLCLLMLRGPQTPGELRARSGRLHTFDDNEDVKAVLQALIDRDAGSVLARLPRRSGRQDHEYMHLLGGDLASVSEDAGMLEGASQPSQKDGKYARLQARVERLEGALVTLAARLGETVDLGERSEESPQNGDASFDPVEDEYDLHSENRS